MAIGEGDRAEMERWFRRALEADGDNLAACTKKLLWLEPKWHGSAEEMMKFARACRDTKNWASGIPFLLPGTHRRMAEGVPLAEQADYYKQLEVWEDIRGVYVESLKQDPENHALRSEYAAYCYLCSHYHEAHAQFEKLGEHLRAGTMFREQWLKEVRQSSAERVRGEVTPGKPPATGFSVLAAHYGAAGRWVDVTKLAQLEVVNARLNFATKNLPDAAPGTRKALAVVYTVDGKVGLSTFPENQDVSLPPNDVASTKLSEVPVEQFSVLTARYGADDNWLDVTETLRERAKDGRLEMLATDLPDPAFGIPKALLIVYAWRGKVEISVTPEGRPVAVPVIQPPGD
jgi:hypothetical protein